MRTRRLIVVAPIVVVTTTLLTAAVIAAGQRSLAHSANTSTPADARPGAADELRRIDAALAAPRACVGPIECDAAHAAQRVSAAASQIDRWPPDRRFAKARARLHAELDARHALLMQLVFAHADQRVTMSEQAQLDELSDTLEHAARATIRAQRSARIIDQQQVSQALTDLRAGRR